MRYPDMLIKRFNTLATNAQQAFMPPVSTVLVLPYVPSSEDVEPFRGDVGTHEEWIGRFLARPGIVERIAQAGQGIETILYLPEQEQDD